MTESNKKMIGKNDNPIVSIALPVYNEEKYIKKTLESLICQDYNNIQIFISDNCSSDKTGEICTSFAKRDCRIDYFRHNTNIGVAENHIFLLNQAHGKYFMFAAGHDFWSNKLISRCVNLLENRETAIIAYGTPIWVDENDSILFKSNGWYDTRGLNRLARFFITFWGGMNPILGIIRREYLPDLKNYNFTGADLVVLTELALKGEFIHATDESFFRRRNRGEEDYKEKLRRYKSVDMKIYRSFFSRISPLARLPIELIRVVIQSDLSILYKCLTLLMLITALPARYMIGKQGHSYN